MPRHTQALLPFLVLFCAALQLAAQPYVRDNRSAVRFAQMYLGADLQWQPQGGTGYALDAQGQSASFAFGNRLQPRMSIGGLHFWGHADFYVSFPLPIALGLGGADAPDYGYSTGIETGAKFFPWRIEHGRLSPYVGFSMNSTGFRLLGEGDAQKGSAVSFVRVPLHAGLVYAKGANLFEINAMYLPDASFDYYISRTAQERFTLPPLFVSIGYKRYMDTTLGAERGLKDGTFDRIEADLEEKGLLNSLSLGIGLSSSFMLKSSPLQTEARPWMGDRINNGVFPELGIGYFHHRWDAQANLAWRYISGSAEAYGFEQKLSRQALTLEAYKFLFNYKGFVPFLGPNLSYENWHLEESDAGQRITDLRQDAWRFGLSFGWDIRPTNIDFWTLRTNLRWYPNMHMDGPDGRTLKLDQIEFNFIQFVWYPTRAKSVRAALR